MNKLWENTKIVLGSILVTLILLEVSARIYLTHFASNEHFKRFATLSQLEKTDWNKQFKFVYHRYLGYALTPDYIDGNNRHNSLGYRGDEFPQPKPAGEYRIVCIGASTTYGAFIDDYHFSYPYLLQQELQRRGYQQARVINAGVGGWTTWESLINLQFRILDLSPDLIIIYHSVNDITTRFVWPPAAYQGDNSGHLHPQFSRVTMPDFYEYSTLVRILLIQSGMIMPHTAIDRAINKKNRKNYFGDDFLQQRQQNSYPQGIFSEVSAMDMLKANKPIYFERNMSAMISIAKLHDIPVLLSTFAVDSHNFPDFPKSSSPEYLQAYAEHDKIIKKLSADQQTFFLDMASNFPYGKKAYFFDGHHVTEEGAAIKATLFADYIQKNILK